MSLDPTKMKLLEERIDDLRRRRKKSDDRKTVEGVIDTATLLQLYKLITQNHLDELFGVLATGKESSVYYATHPDGKGLAVKIYRTATADFRRMKLYIEGDPRFKRIKRGIRPLVYTWAQKEYKNLTRMYEVGLSVPEPIAVSGNVLIMQFIGENSYPAPRMKDEPPKRPSAMFKKIFKMVWVLFRRANLVHADLSEYNVLLLDKPYLIDVSQSVPTSHPNAAELLKRDLINLKQYFQGLGVDTPPIETQMEHITRRGIRWNPSKQ